MNVFFKYALFEINGTPVLVDKKALGQAKKELREQLKRVEGLMDSIEKEITAKTFKGFALQTPEGMKPITLGSLDDLVDWTVDKMGLEGFNLEEEVRKLPDPFGSVADSLAGADAVLYSAALFYTGPKAGNDDAEKKTLYGELVIGFAAHLGGGNFPLELNEVVIAVNNFPPETPPTQQ